MCSGTKEARQSDKVIRLIPQYVDHLWYPILVRLGGYCQIVEMQGKDANRWNSTLTHHTPGYTQYE